MKLIVTHEATDFDAFAAAVAAQRLHPGAVIGLGRHLARPVRDFLALHKDRFPFVRCTSIESAAVDTLIVVDVRSRRRLAHASAVLDRLDEIEQLYVYDHHPAADDDLIGHVDVVEPVGAVTTLLVERLRRVGGDIDVIEATLFALGIYTDTAALTLGNTSPRDARAVAWLLEQGARLPMINRYLYPPLDDAQRRALGQVLGDHEVVTVGGLRVGFGLLRTTRHVEGLAVVTTEACKLENLAALFTVCAVGGRKVEIVARSRSPRVDVAGPIRELGGGGHRGAASAVVKGADAERLRDHLRERMLSCPPTTRRVMDVMTSPVWTVSPRLSLRELDTELRIHRVTGVPVVHDGELLGVVSRRDVERAQAAGRDHLPVASHMSSDVCTAEADASVDDALSVMIQADIGRLPVLRAGRLVGIVSRSDLLQLLYPDR